MNWKSKLVILSLAVCGTACTADAEEPSGSARSSISRGGDWTARDAKGVLERMHTQSVWSTDKGFCDRTGTYCVQELQLPKWWESQPGFGITFNTTPGSHMIWSSVMKGPNLVLEVERAPEKNETYAPFSVTFNIEKARIFPSEHVLNREGEWTLAEVTCLSTRDAGGTPHYMQGIAYVTDDGYGSELTWNWPTNLCAPLLDPYGPFLPTE